MAESHKNIPALHFRDRKEWRKWLKLNHEQAKAVWLIFHKKETGKKEIKYEEAVEEALCFGWIDSVVNKRDADSRYQYYSPRKSSSIWSASNRDRVEKLIAAGKMTPRGQILIDLAKKNGAWDAMHAVEKLILPPDLVKALKKNKTAEKNFNAFPPSAKKIILTWILSAKQKETRKRRIEKTATLAKENIRANQ